MIYVSATNRYLTEKYVDWAVSGLPGAIKLQPQEIIKKKEFFNYWTCSFLSKNKQNSK